MNNEINLKYNIPNKNYSIDDEIKKAQIAYDELINSGMDMTGWLDYADNISSDFISEIEHMAKKIREKFTALVVVGVGGSYLGAAAALDFLKKNDEISPTKIYFAGCNLSSDYHECIINEIEDEDVAVCIISKSGGTTETLVSGNIFMDYLEKRYGVDEKKKRIFIVTDPENGKLRKLVNEEGYSSLPIPQNIGGRFSVLTSVGLLPMAVAGIKISEVLKGAKSAKSSELITNSIQYAANRNMIEKQGYSVELLTSFEPYLSNFIQWLKQLFGESEGKDGKGMFPVNMDCSKDLHSLGQFVQEGKQIFSETFISVKKDTDNISIPREWGLAPDDISFNQLNYAAKKGAVNAHKSTGIPVIEIELPERNEYTFGQAIYFFQMTCAIKGIMMGVNPFNQPGVELYKSEMKKYLLK